MRGNNRSLRTSLVMAESVTIVLPLLILIFVMQARIGEILKSNVETEMQREIETADQMLNMMMDRYDSVLSDFCTDEELVVLVQQINNKRDVLDANSNQIRRQLKRLCNRNEEVEGVTLVTTGGQKYFYDRVSASSMDSTWAGHLVKQDMGGGVHFHGGVSLEQSEDGSGHLLQIARRIVDYRDIHRDLGTVILSFDQEVLWEVISSKTESRLYICEGDQIIASEIREDIGKKISEISTSGISVLSTDNAVTGWKLYDYYSMREFSRLISHQTTLMMVMTVGFLIEGSIAVCLIFKPIFLQVKQIESAMIEVEKGDFSVRVPGNTKLPREVVTIVGGFNKMVEKTGDLIEKLKTSAEEQRNAELSAMEAQIDPHFLYNILDTINWKAIERDEYEISGMVCALADILRYSIRNPGGLVSIGQELYWLSQYTMLQKERIEQPLEVETDVPEKLKGCQIHKMLLQPFVENAIKHGGYQKEGVCRLTIRIRRIEDQIYIMIRDNGKGIPKETLQILNDPTKRMEGHVGIYNVRKRLELYYGEDATCYFESRPDIGTTVHLFVKAIRGGGKNR